MKSLAVLDIETDSLDTETAKPKFIGILDLQTNKYKIIQYSKPKEVQEILNTYDFIITFNGEHFDIPILKNNGIDIAQYKHIDLYKVFKKKAGLLRSGGFKSYSLNNIAKEIKVKIEKGDIDYKIFQKDEWMPEELQEIEKYLKQDLDLTNELWKFLILKFDSLKEFISTDDAQRFKHITMSSGAYGYKVICHLLGLEEVYIDTKEKHEYKGAWVMQPKKESAKGNILYFDFASLYPMMYIHANLFSSKCTCCKKEEKWHGNETFKVNGYYCKKQQGKIEELIKTLFMKRKAYKVKKDNREFAIKIILNSLYGTSAKPSFKHLYNTNVASDCTALSRQCIAFAIKKFEDSMYDVIYADTDSCIIDLKHYQKKGLCKQLAEEISIEISQQFPFPFDEFNLKVDDELKYIQFFIGKKGDFNKKHYLYVNDENKLVVKGLDIIQKNCSKLSEDIFNKLLKEDIIKNLDCKFKREFIDGEIESHIKRDKTIIAKRFNIKPLKSYKSNTNIYYLIGEKYGEGEIFLIKNYKLGAGKGVKYCSVEDANELEIEDLNLEDVYKELGVFIEGYESKKIKKVRKVNKVKRGVSKQIKNKQMRLI